MKPDLYFERGGPIQRFTQQLLDQLLGLQVTVPLRVVGVLMFTWVPLLLFAFMLPP